MPSRKKAKGKARKAAKEAKAKQEAEESQEAVEVEASADQRQVEEGSLEAQLQRLGINAATSSKSCKHVSPLFSSDGAKGCLKLVNEFIAVFILRARDNMNMVDALIAANEATEEEFAAIYSSKMDTVISILLSSGTNHILDGDNKHARFNAIVVCFFEEWTAVKMRESKALVNWAKIVELDRADDHTLVQYFRKRIPCACLDKKYEEVKSVKKIGYCYNSSCSQPGNLVERSKMFCCTRCGLANYCSVECQKVDWKSHKEFCNINVKMKAAFDSKQRV